MPPDAQEVNSLRIVVRPHINTNVAELLADTGMVSELDRVSRTLAPTELTAFTTELREVMAATSIDLGDYDVALRQARRAEKLKAGTSLALRDPEGVMLAALAFPLACGDDEGTHYCDTWCEMAVGVELDRLDTLGCELTDDLEVFGDECVEVCNETAKSIGGTCCRIGCGTHGGR